jgi:hypothetical protein
MVGVINVKPGDKSLDAFISAAAAVSSVGGSVACHVKPYLSDQRIRRRKQKVASPESVHLASLL